MRAAIFSAKSMPSTWRADGLLHAVALLALDLLQAVEQVLALRLPVERHLRHERAGQHRVLVAGEVARQVPIALLVAEEEALALRRQVLGHVPDKLKAREHLLDLDAVAAGHALAQLPGDDGRHQHVAGHGRAHGAEVVDQQRCRSRCR